MSLDQIDHLVILMLENRSFDHVLGYLSIPTEMGGSGRTDVDGLTGTESERYRGREYRVHPLPDTTFAQDPGHEWDDVEEQLAEGFVKNFARHRRGRREPLRAIMGYHTADQVPAHDFLATRFAICDRWFCSVPGPTQPNRIYAVCGHSDGWKKNRLPPYWISIPTIFEAFRPGAAEWRCFYHDAPTLWFFTKYFGRGAPHFRPMAEFYERAAHGDLPEVTWIDPDFGVLPWRRSAHQNDDHPPADTRRGQALVRSVYNALVAGGSDAWSRTMLVVTYDEHGGFHDHVVPPAAHDEHPDFRRYGVRVPALIASPFTGALYVDKTPYDHTSLIKTILRRFLPDVDPADFGRRVEAANDLGAALNLATARTDRPIIPSPGPYTTKVAPRTTFLPLERPGLPEVVEEAGEVAPSWQECLQALAISALAASPPRHEGEVPRSLPDSL